MSTQDDDFTAAFAEFTEPGETPVPVAEPAEPVEQTPLPVESVTPEPVEVPAEPVVEVPPVDLVSQAAPEQAALESLRAELEALKAQSQAIPEPTPVEPAPPMYSSEESATLTKYQEDWPDIAKGEALLRRAEYSQLVKYVFDQVEARYAPVLEYMEERAPKDQYSAIVALVPDYGEVRDKTLAWVETQPAYLKSAYKEVTQRGSAEDVADLIARFKRETGYAAAPVAAPKPAPAVPVTPAIPVAAQKAAAKLAVVPTSRTDQAAPADDNDFESAFAQYAEREDRQARK